MLPRDAARLLPALTCAALFSPIAGAPLHAQQPLRIDLAADAARQVVVDREDGQYLGHVSTVLLADDHTILAVYPKGHGKGAIVMKRSDDGGRTWSDRLPVPASWATSLEVPTIWRATDASGTERLILWSGLWPARLAHSDDDGRTWTELEPAGNWGGIVVMGDVIATRTKGRYLAFCHDDGRFFGAGGTATGTFTLLQTESDDGGLHWSKPHAIWSGSDMHLCEPGAVRSPDGAEIALLLRENARRRGSQVIFSRDEGASWSTPVPLPRSLWGDRHTARYAPDGRLVVVFRDRTLARAPANGGGDLSAATAGSSEGDFVAWVGDYADLRRGGEDDSADAGAFRVRLLDNKKDWDCAYPGLEVLPDGELVATTYGHWEAGAQPFIVSTRFGLAELDARAAAPARGERARGARAGRGRAAAQQQQQQPRQGAATGDPIEILLAYHAGPREPTDPAVLAATDELMKAMPQIVSGKRPGATTLAALCDARRAELVPTPQSRIGPGDPLLRVLCRFDDERTRTTRVDLVTAHPAAAAFPGSVPPTALPVAASRTVDLSVPGRHSLGLYAAPGAQITVVFGDGRAAPPADLRVRIGAHSDDIARRPQWPRMPRITRVFDVGSPRCNAANAYGGLVYVEVGKASAGSIDVLVDGAVEAPLFVLGETTAEQWNEQRQAAGPWAELATRKVILTVPSARIRELPAPTELLQFWDRVLDGAADLATRPRDRARPERYVADVEISAGAMHSGYPIMTHLNAVADMVTLERMRKGPWGLFHELGHNHQSKDWTFAGTGEVTVNLFSLYLCHILCDVGWDQAWGGNLARAHERLREHLQRGTKPWGSDGEGKADLALRLLMYSQLQRGFGWEAFMHTFADFRDLPADQRPKTDAERRDQWFTRLSRIVDRDLGPFFTAWGLEIGDAARAQAKGRLPWFPDDWPR